MNDFQSTIGKNAQINGIGLHTGDKVCMTFKPAPVNFGIRFKRIDLKGEPEVPADIDWVVDTSRGTTLEKNGVRVATVEHVMAALSGLQIDNCLIELDGGETPIADGSSAPFMAMLEGAGVKGQDAKREYIELPKRFRVLNKEKISEITAEPSDTLNVSVEIDFDSNVLGHQKAELTQITNFKEEIGRARTFVFLHELEMLLNHQLIKGGDLSNAIVIMDRQVTKEELDHLAELFDQPTVEVREEGILNNIELNYPNEPARHKLLDVVGDLALLGKPIKARINAYRPGHSTNIEIAKKIRAMLTTKSRVLAPEYDPNSPPIFDINVIKGFLPHKYPFLLVDKIIDLSDEHVVGVKNVTFNEYFFQGHFPDEPIFPGVLIIESMAQTGGILVMNAIEDPENYTTYFLKIEKAKFKRKVVPGDTLILDMELLAPIRRGLCEMKGTAFVGEQVVAEAELMAQIIRKDKK